MGECTRMHTVIEVLVHENTRGGRPSAATARIRGHRESIASLLGSQLATAAVQARRSEPLTPTWAMMPWHRGPSTQSSVGSVRSELQTVKESSLKGQS